MESDKPFEKHAEEKKTQPWVVAAMKQHFQVPEGRTLSASDFDKMADEVVNMPLGVAPEKKDAKPKDTKPKDAHPPPPLDAA